MSRVLLSYPSCDAGDYKKLFLERCDLKHSAISKTCPVRPACFSAARIPFCLFRRSLSLERRLREWRCDFPVRGALDSMGLLEKQIHTCDHVHIFETSISKRMGKSGSLDVGKRRRNGDKSSAFFIFSSSYHVMLSHLSRTLDKEIVACCAS